MSEEEIAASIREEIKQAKSNNRGSVVIAALGAVILVISVMTMPLFGANGTLYSALEGGLIGGVILMVGGLALVNHYEKEKKKLVDKLNNLNATLKLIE